MPVVRPKYRFLHIIWVKSDLVVSRAEVQLGEDRGTGDFSEQLLHRRNWKMVFHGGCVQGSVVDAEPPCAVFLLTSSTSDENGLVLG